MMWIGFTWLRIETSGDGCELGNETSISIKGRLFVQQRGRDSVDGKATRYLLDCPRIEY